MSQFDQIIGKLKELEEEWGIDLVDAMEGLPEESWELYNHQVDRLKEEFGEINTIDSYGGEGCGDEYWYVLHFKDQDVYIRFDGWYASYHGHEFEEGLDGAKEVRPQEKTITVYE